MWCQSHNNSPPWQNSFASDSGLVDVYDAVTGGDPSGPTFDICSGDVPGTPCEGRAELLLGLMARPMGVKPDLLEVGNLQIKMYPDYGYAGPCMPPGFSKWPHVNVQIIKRDDRGGFPGRNILRNYHFTVIIDEGDKCLCVWESKTGFTFKNCNHPSGWGLAMKSVIYDGLEEIWESGNTMVKLTIAAVIAGAVFDWIVVPDPIPGPVPLVQAERPFSAAVRLAVPVYSTWAREDMNGG